MSTNGNGNGHVDSGPALRAVRNSEPEAIARAAQEIIANREMVANFEFIQRKLFDIYLDRRRNIGEECGYPDTTQLHALDFRHIIERDPVANRVNHLYPDECWQLSPYVYESEDIDDETPFELGLKEIGKTLSGSSFYEDEDGDNMLWWYLWQADRKMGVGRFGALLIGTDDGKELNEPLAFKKEGFTEQQVEITYLRYLDETQVQISELDTDKNSPRYGMPINYSVTLTLLDTPIRTAIGGATVTQATVTTTVHWTRIVHLSEDIILHDPRLLVVYDRLYDLRKLYGGSAEMYWKGAFFGLSFETDAKLAGAEVDVAGMKREIENYENSLSRSLVNSPGMVTKTVAPQVVDPTPQIERHIEAICIVMKSPKRKFMGSELGELASSQDMRSWYSQVAGRNRKVTTPKVLVPVITRFIQIGAVIAPEQYYCYWPDTSNLTDMERAQIATQRMGAYAQYVSGQVDSILSVKDMFVREMGYSETEATEIIEARDEEIDSEGLLSELTNPQAHVDPFEMEEQKAGFQSEQQGKQADFQMKLEEKKAKFKPKPKAAKVKNTNGLTNLEILTNVFCSTGEGGGIDPTCSPEGESTGKATKFPASVKAIEASKLADAEKNNLKAAKLHGEAAKLHRAASSNLMIVGDPQKMRLSELHREEAKRHEELATWASSKILGVDENKTLQEKRLRTDTTKQKRSLESARANKDTATKKADRSVITGEQHRQPDDVKARLYAKAAPLQREAAAKLREYAAVAPKSAKAAAEKKAAFYDKQADDYEKLAKQYGGSNG